MRKWGIVLLLAVLVLYPWSNSFAKPAPPAGLVDILEDFSELEGSYEKGEFDEAQEAVKKLAEKMNRMMATVDAKDKVDFSPMLQGIAQSLAQKNEKITETRFIYLQKTFFDFLDKFDHKIHPILTIIEKFIADEALESAEKGDFDNVVSEMKEVGALMISAQKVLSEIGISDQEINEFRKQLSETIQFAMAKDGEKIQAAIAVLKAQLDSFIQKSAS